MPHQMWSLPLTLTLAQIAVIATSVYLHRGLAHRALRLHPLTDGMQSCGERAPEFLASSTMTPTTYDSVLARLAGSGAHP